VEAKVVDLAEQRPYKAIKRSVQIVSEMNEPVLDTLLKTFSPDGPQSPPDLMVVDTLTPAGADAAEKLGVPFVWNNPLPLWHDLIDAEVSR